MATLILLLLLDGSPEPQCAPPTPAAAQTPLVTRIAM